MSWFISLINKHILMHPGMYYHYFVWHIK